MNKKSTQATLAAVKKLREAGVHLETAADQIPVQNAKQYDRLAYAFGIVGEIAGYLEAESR